MKYKTMLELIDMIADRPLKTKIYDIYAKYRPEMLVSKGSQHNHQPWEGGYIDHVTDCMNIARLLYHAMNDKRKLEFTLSDALAVLFLHDIEKISESSIVSKIREGNDRPRAKELARRQILDAEGITSLLTPELQRAVDNIEIERQYSNTTRGLSPLATFCHLCDITSARIWFDHPKPINEESWGDRESEEQEQLWGV